jgi:hypothetical protein
MHSSTNFEHFFKRLHDLQALYCDGQIKRGSPEHSEILALEELESLFVKEQMKRHYEVELRLLDRARDVMVTPVCAYDALAGAFVMGAASLST